MRRLTTRRAGEARQRVQANRCPERPGITHAWRWTGVMTTEGFDYTGGGAPVPLMRCNKCDAYSH